MKEVYFATLKNGAGHIHMVQSLNSTLFKEELTRLRKLGFRKVRTRNSIKRA